MKGYGKLKSGTDIRGRAIATESAPALLTEKAVVDLASAFVIWTMKRTNSPRCKIAVGRDSRITGPAFEIAIVNALRYSGLEIFDCGMFSTPAAFLVTQFPSMKADGSIMITASHHPSDINGLKFFTPEGGVNAEQLAEIIAVAESDEQLPVSSSSVVVRRDFLRLYCDSVSDLIRKGTGLFMPFRGMKIAVDAGHGAGGFFATRILKPLGADITPSQFLEPDGTFPAHPPNPENKQAMQSLKERVAETGADIGIIFDADVDRCAVVAADGTEINRSALIALASAMVLKDHPGATIVTDSVTTEGVRKFIESHGGVQKRFKRGYRNVIDEAKRLCELGTDAPLAIESSGHVAFAEHYFLDDGAYFIAKILIALANLRKTGGALTDLIEGLEAPLEERDIRLNFTADNWREVADRIITRLNALSERMLELSADNYEGVRAYVSHADGYFIVRTSVHDPVLPIYIESNKKGGAKAIARFLLSFLVGFTGLDVTPLSEFTQEPDAPASEPQAETATDSVPPDANGEFAAEEPADEQSADTAEEEQMILSFDGGETFETLTENFPVTDDDTADE